MNLLPILGKPRSPLCRGKHRELYLCASWPVNTDGCIRGIDIFNLDCETSQWQRKTVIEFEEDNVKHGFGCVCVDQKLFILGGERWLEVNGRLRFDSFDNVESYDINTGRKETLPSIPDGGRTMFWTIAVGKYIYIFGGQSHAQTNTNECMRFDIELLSWHRLKPMPEPHFRRIAQNSIRELDGRIYVGCGPNMESFFVYDTTADNWTQLTSPNAIIMNPILFCWDGLLFAVGDGGLNRYDPDKDTWTHVEMSSGGQVTIRDAIEFRHEILTCAFPSITNFSIGFGKLKWERNGCASIPIKEAPSKCRPEYLLFLN